MDDVLPAAAFPSPSLVTMGHDVVGEAAFRHDRLFQTLSTRVGVEAEQPGPQILQIAMDRSDEKLLLLHYRERLWLVLTASLVLCAGTGYAIARSGMRPIAGIAATARRIRSSTLDQRITTDGLPTELRSLAATFNEMLDRLEASFAQISQFSADVAHELRTPINNLVGEIEVALGKTRSADEYRDVLGSALEECTRIGRVIRSLLFLARAEAARANPHHEMIEVRREIEAVREFYEAAAAETGIDLVFAPGERVQAGFDRNLFQQAIGNLVANALAHTPKGGRVEISAAVAHGRLKVAVHDTGRGIPPEDLPHVFDRFYRADKARSGASSNVGLGLAVVRSIARLHGGTVVIDSELGQGTRVVVETPVGRDAGLSACMTES
jgi:two-component system heavy metal sensor histidine kinase CusS